MESIIALSVDSINMAHNAVKVRPWRFEKQVIVIAHQAIGMNDRIKALMGFFERLEKALVIGVTMKNGLPSSPPIHDVIQRLFVLDANGSGFVLDANGSGHL